MIRDIKTGLKEDRSAIFQILRNSKIDDDSFAAIASITHSRIVAVENDPSLNQDSEVIKQEEDKISLDQSRHVLLLIAIRGIIPLLEEMKNPELFTNAVLLEKKLEGIEKLCQQIKYMINGPLTSEGEPLVTVPITPTEDQWNGMARAIIRWLDFGTPPTPASLYKHLQRTGIPIPQWLKDEPEMGLLDHAISAGTRTTLIYKAMLFDYKPPETSSAGNNDG